MFKKKEQLKNNDSKETIKQYNDLTKSKTLHGILQSCDKTLMNSYFLIANDFFKM